jgi:hypothetical protein
MTTENEKIRDMLREVMVVLRRHSVTIGIPPLAAVSSIAGVLMAVIYEATDQDMNFIMELVGTVKDGSSPSFKEFIRSLVDVNTVMSRPGN